MIVEPSKDDLDETLGLLMQVLNNPNMGDIPRDSALVMRLRDTCERVRNQFDSAIFAADVYLLGIRTARMLQEVKKTQKLKDRMKYENDAKDNSDGRDTPEDA
jgi:hypothetical protein